MHRNIPKHAALIDNSVHHEWGWSQKKKLLSVKVYFLLLRWLSSACSLSQMMFMFPGSKDAPLEYKSPRPSLPFLDTSM